MIERQIAAQAGPPRSSWWATAQARAAAQAARTRTALGGTPFRSLVAFVCGLVAFASLPGLLTFNHLHDRAVLQGRGVHVVAWVVDNHTPARGSDSLTVRPVEPPYFETALDRWPGGVDVGDRLAVVYDPRDPERVAAVDEPLIDLGLVLVVAFDLLGVAILFLALVLLGELLRRAWVRLRDGAPNNDRLLGHRPPLGRRPRALARLETGQVVLVLIGAPVLGVVLSGLAAWDVVGHAAALRDSGARAEATVERSDWGSGGWLDVRFSLPDGAEQDTVIRPSDHVYYEGDVLEVVYDPQSPGNAQAVEDTGWQSEERVAVGVFVVFAATAVVAVPVAVFVLVRRALRVRRGAVAAD